ncbi:hypothetical protein [Granulicoccus phenolivorans]|uniref:aspartate-alanine antiporter-like transporter n=1 Tax=Granulicoccus phenolivorans TaxID=266854 RepID=UPI000404A8B9|nr:hypothetical protein [Granulicoccus phenolivorans]
MFTFLADHLLLSLFLVLAAGAVVGAIPFGAVRPAAVGTLIAGLAYGVFVHIPAYRLVVFQDLGLGLFVYLVGLEAGETLLRGFRRQLPLIAATVLALGLAAVAATLLGGALGVSRSLVLGAYAGSLASAPALSLARELTASQLPAVGFALGSLVGMGLAVAIVAVLIRRPWPGRRDPGVALAADVLPADVTAPGTERATNRAIIVATGGLALGFVVALFEAPLPGGGTFALGAAGGPLIVGMFLGALRRTGGPHWRLPRATDQTLRRFGLMLFLAAIGIASGPAFVTSAFTLMGLRTLALGALVTLIACGLLIGMCFLLGQSAARTTGAVAGLFGQPGLLSSATARSGDPRVAGGYAGTFAIGLLSKVVVIPFLL